MMNLWPDSPRPAMELSPFDIIDSQYDAFYQSSFKKTGVDMGKTYSSLGYLEWRIINRVSEKSVIIVSVDNYHCYPCTVEWEGGKSRARTEAEFIGLVAKILNHQKTRLMIAELMK